MTTVEQMELVADTMAAAVARHLPGWRVKGEEHRARVLVNEDGAEVYFRQEYNKPDRIEVSGAFPRSELSSSYFGPHGQRFVISCALSRGPEKIARDVERRLLPGYLPKYAEARASRDAHDQQLRDAEKLAADLGLVFGEQVRGSHHDWTIYPTTLGGVRTVVKVQGYGSVNFDVDVEGPENARKLARFVRDLARGIQ